MPKSRTTPLMEGERQRERVQQLMQKSVVELAGLLKVETDNFLHQRAYDECIGMALFTRAINCHDEEAWVSLYNQYTPLVLTWVTQHPHSNILIAQEGVDPIINASFAKFSVAMTPMKLSNFTSLAALLTYIKLCVHSTVSDMLRVRRCSSLEVGLDSIEIDQPGNDDPATEAINSTWREQVWQIIQADLLNEKERIVMQLSYIQAMKPREIRELHDRLFPSVDDIYAIKKNVTDRLRRNRTLQAMRV